MVRDKVRGKAREAPYGMVCNLRLVMEVDHLRGSYRELRVYNGIVCSVVARYETYVMEIME